METSMPLLLAAIVGFGHAFEADHLAAISNIVTRRDKLMLALKDGAYWGLGHTSTILLIGVIIMVGKATFLHEVFTYFEAGVGLMLMVLGVVRLRPLWDKAAPARHGQQQEGQQQGHQLAYGVGLIHGLAGSGTLILLVMTEIEGTFTSLLYLLLFGLGSVFGMLTVASIFGLPFARSVSTNKTLQQGLILLSSLLCITYGSWVVYQNMIAA